MTLAADTSQTAVSTRPSPVSVSLSSVAANALIVLFCMADANNGNTGESLSIGTTGGLTWTRNTQANGGGGAVCAIFTAPSGAGGSFSITVVDSDGLGNGAAELAVVPVMFTDTNGGTPGAGATGADQASITTTVADSWIWFNNFSGGTTNGNQTATYQDASFDGGDQVSVAKWNTTTPTPGTVITPTQGGAHGTLIEITPGTGATGQDSTPPPFMLPDFLLRQIMAYQAPGDPGATGSTVTVDAAAPVTATITAAATETANASATAPITATIAAAATEVANATATAPITATITASATEVANATAAETITATITATITNTPAPVTVDGTRPITATIAAAALEVANAQATSPITATITAALSVGAAPVTVDGTRPTTATITAAATEVANATATVPVTATITAAAAAVHPVDVVRLTTVTIAATATEVARAQAAAATVATIHADLSVGAIPKLVDAARSIAVSVAAHLCVEVLRPNTGTTTRPSSGTTVYSTAMTARPSTGVTSRPDTGETEGC